MKIRVQALSILVILVSLGLPAWGGVASAQAPAAVELRGYAVALDLGGAPWAVWSADNGHDTDLYYSRWTGQAWRPARVLYADPATWDDFPSLAFAADGTPWLAWTSADAEQGRLYVSRWVGYRWSTPVEVPQGTATHPRQAALAAAPDGGFWLAWVGFDGTDDEILASHWDGLSWSQPRRVGEDDADPLAYDTQPRLAVDGEGRPWLVWVSSQGLFDDAVVASRWSGTAWSAEQMVSAPDGTPDVFPSLALDSEGQPWVAWQDAAGSGAGAYRRIFVSRWQAEDAAWTAEELVSSAATLPIDEERPDLSFDTTGQAHLVWTVAGQTSGVAYVTWDGTSWTQPAWAAEQVAVDAAVLLPAEIPWLLWANLTSTAPVPLSGQRLAGAMSPLPQTFPQSQAVIAGEAILNRYCAWGDSITLGAYDDPMGSGDPVGPYPGRLQEKLSTRVAPSEVFNKGISGETTKALKQRIGTEAGALQPQFALIMEGTNDVTHQIPPNDVIFNLEIILDILKKYVNVDGMRPWLATIIPRIDNYNKDTSTLNGYIRDLAVKRRVPLADQWQAFYDSPNWRDLMRDSKHPNKAGMQLLTDTFYDRLLETHSGLFEETEPPVTWVEPLPANSPCGEVLVQWSGTDNLSYVTSYDVQVQVNGGGWQDWHIATADTGGTYYNQSYGAVVEFRVRGRDVVGNQSNWSNPVSTQISDDDPPEVQMTALPAAQKAPFVVSWQGTDLCGQVTGYELQYRVASTGSWSDWPVSSGQTSVSFDPPAPQYGQAYYFRVLGWDEAGNQGESAPVSTLLARYTLGGQVFNTRHQPVLKPQVTATDALAVEVTSNRYTVYLSSGGTYHLSVSHSKFGPLPAMRNISVTNDLSGLDMVLPPLDDVVSDGGFEGGGWGDWQISGTLPPTLGAESHTGNGAVLMGGPGDVATLSQSFAIPNTLTNATLSYLVRLDNDADGSSTVRVELEGTIISDTQTIQAGGWTHVWLPVEQAVGQQNVTLTFTVSDTAAVRLDEVSLGSALPGGYWVYLPSLLRAYAP